MATLYHTTARITRSTTHVHTNINDRHTNTATHRKTNHAPAAAWRRAETAFCVAPVSKMPDQQAAQATGSVLPAKPSLRRAGLSGPRNARPNRRDGVSRHLPVWSTLGSASSANRVRFAQELSPSCICRRPSHPQSKERSWDNQWGKKTLWSLIHVQVSSGKLIANRNLMRTNMTSLLNFHAQYKQKLRKHCLWILRVKRRNLLEVSRTNHHGDKRSVQKKIRSCSEKH